LNLASAGQKDPGALKTIGELSEELGVAQHILRYWETKFPQLRPMQRAGNRRYYRPADVDLAHRIHRLLSEEGYTVRGVQKLLRDKGAQAVEVAPAVAIASAPPVAASIEQEAASGVDVFRLIDLRNRLASALDG
jgi:DNA-binding transcriptional MerR regulator